MSFTRPPRVRRMFTAAIRFKLKLVWLTAADAPVQRVTEDLLKQLLDETDARTLRQFLIHTFHGLGNGRR